ncbi:mitogen-activated protein kinase-binding protein 1-like [Synchiropus splendidus]|uniref:mitogen-activated protein kinase-binding protein 1-like n=1 Tax=Synchiropus splendidus TaxID=270530 RepID=UPI00237E6106|nr:mitogen-activated protein kinase-binding protein 1-like [Synchiropus splendidus]
MPGDGFTITSRIRNLLRSPSIKQKKNKREQLTSKVTLEKVLGITAAGNSGFACDPKSGLVAYPAGCVVVLLNPKKNTQHHLINTSRKTITALSFSPDGKHLATGESGHLPAVRLWDVSERRQVAELQKHKYGISCVAFSPNSKYIVSVGNQHDMLVNVWAWKKDIVVAANKVSSKVTGVSFSEDSSYFVTVGNRHVKFWYLDHCKANKASDPVPLLGRSGLLGELRNNFFCDVACGRGSKSDSTFCITSSGLLCELNSKRMLDKWVDLRTGVAQALSLSEDMIFCGCADGTVRAFSPADLCFISTLPRPHKLGSDVSSVTKASLLHSTNSDDRYPDCIAVTYDNVSHRLSCVYNDHSVYVWDVRDVHRVGKVHSARFHAACVWDLEMFPDVPGQPAASLSAGSFISCSADNTIRVWNMEGWSPVHIPPRNVLSCDLQNIIYIDDSTSHLKDADNVTAVNVEKPGEVQTAESRTGIRTICVSPDGKHLASGDRNGMLRVHDLATIKEILKVDAHDAEILSLEYSKPETGLKLLATASRDRLIHVLDAEDDYSLVQTLDEHSSSITAVRFAANDNKVRMISCGADKSIYFRTAHKTDRGTEFRRSHHMVRKSTLYDMDVDPTCRYAAVGCQDRRVRIFNISSGKQKKLYKGSLSEDGSLLRVQIDPSGQYVATSCSDKNISIFDFYTGECVASMFGHSEIVTGMKFTNDCKHLLSASGDSCIFVWRLAPELTINMRGRLRQNPNSPLSSTPTLSSRREVFSAPALVRLSSDSELEHEEVDSGENDLEDTHSVNNSSDSSQGEEDTGCSDEGHEWELPKHKTVTPETTRRPRRQWSHRIGSMELVVKSMLDLRQLETFAHEKQPPRDRETLSTFNLQEAEQQQQQQEEEEGEKKHRPWQHSSWTSQMKDSRGDDGIVLSPEGLKDDAGLLSSEYVVKELDCRRRGIFSESQDGRSPDSACSLGFDSRACSPDSNLNDSADVEFLSQDSSDEELKGQVTSLDEALRAVTGGDEQHHQDFLKQNFETLADGCANTEQSRVPRLSMSSRFLARGHNNRGAPLFTKMPVRELGSHSAKPPVSKVRPMMDAAQKRSTEDRTPVLPWAIDGPKVDAVSPKREVAPVMRLQKKRTAASHLWRLSNPPPNAPLQHDRASNLQKSHSAQNLVSDVLQVHLPSAGHREYCKRPQHLFLDCYTPKPSFHFSSPSTGSPQSPRSPKPWESPKLKPPQSYMNPTASSIAKSSRSSSLSDGLQIGTPPSSSFFFKSRKSSGEFEPEPPSLSSSPVAAFPSRLPSPLTSKIPSSPQPTAKVVPNTSAAFTLSQPSRIPLRKQPLGPRRSLCADIRLGSGEPDLACDASPVTAGKQALGRIQSLNFEPCANLLPVRQKRDSLSESLVDPVDRSVTEKCRTPPALSKASNSELQTSDLPVTPAAALHHSPAADCSISMEVCQRAASELQSSLRRTISLYMQINDRSHESSEDQQEMKSILYQALRSVKTQLDSLPGSALPQEGVKGEGEKTMALLEQYAELLLKSVERRLDTKI